MLARRRTHVLVVDPATGRPVGILSTLDVALSLAGGAGPGR
jgi:CBS domain-containing protein